MHALHMHYRLGLIRSALDICMSDTQSSQCGHHIPTIAHQRLLDLLRKSVPTQVLWLIADNLACHIEALFTAHFVLHSLHRTCYQSQGGKAEKHIGPHTR